MVIQTFKPFSGQHCESTATGCLLKNLGIELSEAMLIGLGQAFGFIYWKMKIMNLPFIGGRSKQFSLTEVLCSHLNLDLDARESSSRTKAWKNIQDFIDADIPVGLQLDFYHLEYVDSPIHFPGHFVCVYGYDDHDVQLVDTNLPPEKTKTGRSSLEKARFEKGPMSAKARSWTISKKKALPALKEILPKAIKETAIQFLNPPIQNFGYKGIYKLSKEITKWLDMATSPEIDLADSAMLMEGGGTGGALFRNFYRDFLKESGEYLPGNSSLKKAQALFTESALNWTEISDLISKAGKSGEQSWLKKASAVCYKTAEIEKEAMEQLLNM